MFGRTLTLYFGRQFAKMVFAIFALAFLLILVVTYFEFFNRAFMGDAEFGWKLALVATFRVPSVAEEALPFAVLYGSIAAFVMANRRLEIVIARAAGVSAWQFLLPACVVGLIFGTIATTIYNPLSANLLSFSNTLGSEVFNRDAPPPTRSDEGGPVWVRQSTAENESIIGSAQSLNEGLTLIGVTAYVFGRDGSFQERIDAARAEYAPGAWVLQDSTVTAANATPQKLSSYSLPTNLSADEVKRTFLQLDSVSFWTLPELAAAAKRAGVPADRYELQYHQLLSRPVLLLAMVLIAANVSLRFSRSNDIARMIIAGVAVGFMLYVVTKIAWDMGSGGIVPPVLAAWLPAIVATLIGATVLLHLEDG